MPRRRKPTSEESIEARHALRAAAEGGRLLWADAIRRMRKALGMTQSEFASRFKVTVPQLSAIENGSANPTVRTLDRLGKVYGLKVGLVPVPPRSEGAPR